VRYSTASARSHSTPCAFVVAFLSVRHSAPGAATNPTFFFFFNDPATTEIYTLSLHDALPIFIRFFHIRIPREKIRLIDSGCMARSEEHTSELQSRENLVCRLLLEKKKTGVSGGGSSAALHRWHPRRRSHADAQVLA